MKQFIFILLFFCLNVGFAQTFPTPEAQAFLRSETTNNYVPNTTVAEAYRPKTDQVFKINYIEIPVSKLNISDSGLGSENLRKQLLFEKNGEKYFRFFVHPESEKLYQPLITKYGITGFYWASATSSTRSVLAWNPENSNDMLFLKLSLAQYQDGLGRVIPDWEVRRSVGISSAVAKTNSVTWRKHGAEIISEFIGASVKKNEGLGFFVDEKQGEIFEHGLIARDPDFLTQNKNEHVQPLFSLFTRTGKKAPLIVELWKKSGEADFYKFIDQFLFKSFIEMNSYLFFHQGVVPEIHGQNVLVRLNKAKNKIMGYYHRDVGSMKIDLRLRYIHGLGIDDLRTPNAAFDFKFARSTEVYQSVFLDYLNDWLFKWGYFKNINDFIPGFDPEKTKSRLLEILLNHVREKFPLKSKYEYKTVEGHMNSFYKENPPLNWKPIDVDTNLEKVSEFINTQKDKSQFMNLPESWIPYIRFTEKNFLFTEYGLLKLENDGKLNIYFYATKDFNEFKVAKSKIKNFRFVRKKSALKKVGFYSGTFDPPHKGHLELLERAMRDLQLDVMYVLPNINPEHKPGASSNEDRLKMTKLAFANDRRIIVADTKQMSIVRDFGMGGYIQYITETFLEGTVFQIMGDDSYVRLKDFGDIPRPKNLVIAVSARDDNFELLESSLNGARVVSLGAELSGRSSTKIRKSILSGQMPVDLDEKVFDYVQKNHLYQQVQCVSLF